MSSQDFPFLSMSESNCEDRATAAILAAGRADGVPALALRYWRSGIPGGSLAAPVFITWLLGVGRFCATVKYGQYSLKGEDWYIDTRAGLRSTQSPLEQAPGGPQGRRGPAASVGPQRARGAGPGLPGHGAGPAHGAPRQLEQPSPALGLGALHRQAGRGGNRPPLSPVAGEVPSTTVADAG